MILFDVFQKFISQNSRDEWIKISLVMTCSRATSWRGSIRRKKCAPEPSWM